MTEVQPSPPHPTPNSERGPLAWMANNSVASNLLMIFLIFSGLVGAYRTKQEVFPEFSLDIVNVSVAYPGAGPAEVEQGILLAIEERVRGIDGVKRISSSAGEGSGSVSIETLIDADPEQLLADVKSEVDRIITFPEDAERPNVSLLRSRRTVISLIIAGDQELSVLHALAERARAELLASGEVTQITLEGVPPLEIAVEIPQATLERHGLTLEGVAREVTRASLELPGGGVETDNGEVLVRVADRKLAGHELEDIVLRGGRAGGEIRLGDVGQVIDGFADTKQRSLFNGRPAVRLTVYRVGEEKPNDIAAAVRDYADELRVNVPAGVDVTIWNDTSEGLRDRVNLLFRNAMMGLILVVVILTLFLDIRLAFWVALGIPVSFLGSFLLLGAFGVSINMITLFAFIVTLGMVVDDAIVVGERTFAFMSEGQPPMQAAISAAQEMAVPITFAILTTIAAFSPLFFVPGVMGKIMMQIPAVVIAVLVLSLVESFLILPAHLGHRGDSSRLPRKGLSRVQSGVLGKALDVFIQRAYRPFVHLAIRNWPVTIALALVSLSLSIAVVVSGQIPFNFFPQIEGDIVKVQAKLPYGAPLERTEAVYDVLERTLREEIQARKAQDAVRGVFTKMGEAEGSRMTPGQTGSHLASISVALVPSDERSFSAEEFSKSWRARVPELPGVKSLAFSAATGPGVGAPVAIKLVHRDIEVLAQASEELALTLRDYPTLKNVENEYAGGKEQVDFSLRDSARSLGLSAQDVARQLRSAFYGAEAVREQRGRNELKIIVRLPLEERSSEYHLESLRLRSPTGAYVPLEQLVDSHRTRAATTIKREEGQRYVTVSAELVEGVPSPEPTLDDLQQNIFPSITQQYPGLNIELVGAQREQREAFAALSFGFQLAMLAIFALLAIPFRSYAQPLIIMFVIPFGFVGAVVGHAYMGYGLSIMSMFGIIALSGVVVNDSLVLIDAANRARARGETIVEAIVQAGMARFRPILLTSLTTYFGLAPMIAETSTQARFLIPMAISLGYGILYATIIVLLVVPALYAVVETGLERGARLRRAVSDSLTGRRPAP